MKLAHVPLFLAVVLLTAASVGLGAVRPATSAGTGYPWRSSHLDDWHRTEITTGAVELPDVGMRTARPGTGSGAPAAVLELRSFALYVLSRGNGVSEGGQKALADFRKLLGSMQAKGEVVEVSDTRIGLEGETRICARFASAEHAAKAWTDMQRSLTGADLVQLKAEMC